MTKGQLFGGALVTAGMCAAAVAQSFSIGVQPAGNYVGAYLGGFRSFSIDGFYDESESSGTAYARALGRADVISAYGFSGDSDVAYTIHFSPIPFTVDQDVQAVLSWDFRGDTDGIGGRYIDSLVQVSDTNGVIASADLSNPTGSVGVYLTAGEQYTIFGTALATGGVSVYSLVVPSPGGAGLFALAGLAVHRRRRR